MTADTITEDIVANLEEEIHDIDRCLIDLLVDIRESDITPAEAAQTYNKIASSIARLAELYATPTNTNQ
jgi:hypothetical protein